MIARLTSAALAALTAALIAGCGVRGALDMPPDPQGEARATASAESGQGKPEGAAPKPHKGFILDDLLR